MVRPCLSRGQRWRALRQVGAQQAPLTRVPNGGGSHVSCALMAEAPALVPVMLRETGFLKVISFSPAVLGEPPWS